MKIKGQLKRTPAFTLVMIIGLPSGTSSQVYNSTRTPEENEIEKQKLFNKEIVEYEGPITEDDLAKAVKMKISAVITGPFLIEKNRRVILDLVKNLQCPKIALFDALPYEFCRPQNKEAENNFNDYKKFISLPTSYEGFTQIKLNGLLKQSIPEYYRMKSFADRNFVKNIPEILNQNKMGAQTLLATRYAIKTGASVLQQLMVFYSNTGKEVAYKRDPVTNEIIFECYQNISALDFYTYINHFIKALNDIGYNDTDFFSAALSIQIHTSIKKGNILEMQKIYGEDVCDNAVLLRKAYVYADSKIDTVSDENIGKLFLLVTKGIKESFESETRKKLSLF